MIRSKRTIDTSHARVQPDRRGATAVEFAVVLPILLLFIFGLFELYSVFRVHSEAVTALARGGERRRSLRPTTRSLKLQSATTWRSLVFLIHKLSWNQQTSLRRLPRSTSR